MSRELVFQNRDFSTRLDRPDLRFTVNAYSYEAIGGCNEMSVSATGGELSLWDLINWLRCPVVKYSKLGAPVWWGYVHQVAVRQGELEVAVSLDSMVNRVAVAYSYVVPGSQSVGQRKTTAWADNLTSQAEFGIKEFLSSASGMSDAGALARQGAILGAQAWPQGGVTGSPSGSPRGRVRYSGAKKSLSATLTCRGWWQTLDWKYAAVGVTQASEITNVGSGGTGTQNVGTTTEQKVMQQITTGAKAVNAMSVKIYASKTGTPADDLRVELYIPDGTGMPAGSAIASGTIANAQIGSTAAWLEAVFTMPVNLIPNAMYAVVISRSSIADNTNYFVVSVDTGLGYGGGVLRINNGSTWVARGTDADLRFITTQNNNVDSLLQIADLVSGFGQFLTATDYDALSGVLMSSYQNGESSALQVITNLMAAGGPNGRRLLSRVDVNRRVQIYEEPATGTAGYFMDNRGNVSGPGGIAIEGTQPPVGAWMRMKDLLPGVVDLTKLVDPSLQFIEASSWDSGQGDTYRYKGQPSIESLLAIGG